MAQAVGRITGEPGVVIATSGPGASNLATGLVTATQKVMQSLLLPAKWSVAISWNGRTNPWIMRRFEPITKYSAEVQDPDTLSEIVANAYRLSKAGKPGASFISIPQDVVD